MLKPYIQKVLEGENLLAEDVVKAIGHIMDGEASPSQIAGFLISLRCKGETVEELAGAATAMRQRMVPIEVKRQPLIDTCGTGGSGKGKFNISTAVAFIAASAGAAVAKHGNRAVSSKSGSADVLAELGVNIGAEQSVVEKCINDIGIGFLFAPNCHPAMKYAAPVRRELGVRTLFNVLGPLTNPANAPRQLLGVFAPELTEPLATVLGRLGSEYAWVIHGEDGLDEITVCGKTQISEWDGSKVVKRIIDPTDLGIPIFAPESLKGGTPIENAAVFRQLLQGSLRGPIFEAVALNSGAALLVAGLAATLEEGYALSHKTILSGKAYDTLNQLVEMSNQV